MSSRAIPAWLLAALLCTQPAFATDGGDFAIDNRQLRLKAPAGYAADLTAGNTGDRLFAARELRRLARSWQKRAQGSGDAALDAKASLADLRRDALVAAEMAVVEKADVRALCADLLAVIGRPTSRAPLEHALALEDRRRVDKRIEAALRVIP
jgi:hypothetical protein